MTSTSLTVTANPLVTAASPAAGASVEPGWPGNEQGAGQGREHVPPGAPGGSTPPPAASAGTAAAATPADGGKGSPDLPPLEAWRRVLRSNFFAVAIFSVFINLLMLTIPIYLFQISDRVLTSRSLDTLVMLSLLAGAFIAILSLLDVMRRRVLGRVATQTETILGGPVLAGLVNTARLSDDGSVSVLRNLHQVRSFISGPVMLMLFDAPMAPLYFAAVFLIHPHLGMIAVGSSLLLLVIAILNQRLTSDTFANASLHASKADEHAESLARNAQVVNAMGMLNQGVLMWGREQAKALTDQLRALDRNFWISGLSKFIRLLTQIAMLGWGGYLALNGELTGGMMIAASIIAGRALQPVEGMIEGWRTLAQTRTAYKRVQLMLENMDHEGPKLMLPKPSGELVAEKILYLPKGVKKPVLNGINFKIEASESMAVVGPSGSGKSTLSRILVGCLHPTAGAVRLDGTEIRNWHPQQFGAYTGYLPQDVELFPGSIKQNICRLDEVVDDEKVFEAASLAGVHEMISSLPKGYETVLESNGAPLSGGQKQRVALARAFYGMPSLVILDEPNSNLDAAGEAALTRTLERAKARGITVVVITQRPALLNSVDKVLILRAGRIEALGTPQEVLRRLARPDGKSAPAPSPSPAKTTVAAPSRPQSA
ncbi:MAG: type I secretion system permease/ATPase [Pseudomonadota bacterium]